MVVLTDNDFGLWVTILKKQRNLEVQWFDTGLNGTLFNVFVTR